MFIDGKESNEKVVSIPLFRELKLGGWIPKILISFANKR